MFLIGIAFVALWGIANPSFQSLMSQRVSGNEQGQLQGAIGSMRALTGMIGPVLFTQAFAYAVSHHGSRMLGLPFLIAAALLGLALLIGLRVLPANAKAPG